MSISCDGNLGAVRRKPQLQKRRTPADDGHGHDQPGQLRLYFRVSVRVAVTSFNGGFDIADPNNTFSFSYALGSNGSFTKAGPGKLVLMGVSGLSSYTGGTILGRATSSIDSDGDLGDASGRLRFTGTATLQAGGQFSVRLVGEGARLNRPISIRQDCVTASFDSPATQTRVQGVHPAGSGAVEQPAVAQAM